MFNWPRLRGQAGVISVCSQLNPDSKSCWFLKVRGLWGTRVWSLILDIPLILGSSSMNDGFYMDVSLMRKLQNVEWGVSAVQVGVEAHGFST